MPIPRLPLPASPHSIAFAAVVARLMRDPTLSAYVRTWRTWQGDTDDGTEPTWEELPWVRLTPGAAPSDWEAVGVTRSPLAVRIETRQEGTRVSDALDLWGAITAALFPGDRSLIPAMNADMPAGNGVVSYGMTQPSYSAQAEADGIMLVADGFFLFNTYLITSP